MCSYNKHRLHTAHSSHHLSNLMASAYCPDVWEWLSSLPPITQWNKDAMSICFCTTKPSRPSMNFMVKKGPQNNGNSVFFSIYADIKIPVTLWTSNLIFLKSRNPQNLEEIGIDLFCDLVNAVLRYGSCKKPSYRVPTQELREDFMDIFNLVLLTLVFLTCIYEAPQEIRWGCLNTLMLQLTSPKVRETSKHLVKVLGSNIEEAWMRSLNLAIVNRIVELRTSNHSFNTPLPLFSYALSAVGLWKVQFYCPIVAMNKEDSTNANKDERLLFSLNYQQLEGVIQLAYKVTHRDQWIDVVVSVDNIRCDVNPLVPETLMDEKGHGSEEKHFPSRISIQLTPRFQTEILSVSATKSSENPTREVELERSIEGSFDPPNSMGISVSSSESVSVSIKPWKFEQSVFGGTASLNWFLHDGVSGKEVFSSKPSKLALLQPRAWFRDRYSSAYRPFTKQGGIIFAGDEYGESVWWKVCKSTMGKKMDWEIKGQIWLTYLPNKHRSFYSETRRLDFKELLYIPAV